MACSASAPLDSAAVPCRSCGNLSTYNRSNGPRLGKQVGRSTNRIGIGNPIATQTRTESGGDRKTPPQRRIAPLPQTCSPAASNLSQSPPSPDARASPHRPRCTTRKIRLNRDARTLHSQSRNCGSAHHGLQPRYTVAITARANQQSKINNQQCPPLFPALSADV